MISIFKFASALVLAAYLCSPVNAADSPRAYQGYVEGEYIYVGPITGGRITTLAVKRGGNVEKDAALFQLDDTEAVAARAQASAMLKQAQDQLANVSKPRRAPEIAAVTAQRTQAEAQLRLAQTQLDRQKRLVGSTAFAQEQLDQAQATYDQIRGRVAELNAQLTTAQMSLGRDPEIQAAASAVAANEAAVAQADWRVAQMNVAAPVAGRIVETFFNPGEFVAPGQPVASILPPGNVKIRFFVPQATLPSISMGTRLQVMCDGCATAIPARVNFISSSAEFTPPVIYSREQRSRLVFMVEAQPDSASDRLRIGQPVDVTIAP